MTIQKRGASPDQASILMVCLVWLKGGCYFCAIFVLFLCYFCAIFVLFLCYFCAIFCYFGVVSHTNVGEGKIWRA